MLIMTQNVPQLLHTLTDNKILGVHLTSEACSNVIECHLVPFVPSSELTTLYHSIPIYTSYDGVAWQKHWIF